MNTLYTSGQCRELDRIAIVEHGVPGIELMHRAGRAAFDALTARWPNVRSITVFCGKGNNAGDGYIIAGLAHRLGFDTQVLQVGDGGLRGDAELARQWAAKRGVVSESGSAPLRGGVVVDALLGTGLNGPPREGFAQAIQLINGSGLPVLAVDVPSGLNVDTGAASGAAVGADVTVSFIGPKLGLHTGQGLALRGELVHARLGVSPSVLNAVPGCPLLTFDAQSLPSLDTNLYKHRAGHLVVVGGDESMGGAPLMAAEAALCVGTGLVSVVTRGAHRNAILSRRPEIMVQDSANTDAVADLFARATALVIGPGIGRTPWGDTLTRRALTRPQPKLIDADGLHWLASSGKSLRDFAKAATPASRGSVPSADNARNRPAKSNGSDAPVSPNSCESSKASGEAVADITEKPNPSQDTHVKRWRVAANVLTPHTGEAAKLLGATTAEIERDRPGAALQLANRFGAIVVLKGAGSICAADRLLGVCGHGNPGMATAGTGDVLSGVIGGLLAQGLHPEQATTIGTSLHSRAGDLAAERRGQRSLIATDLFDSLSELLR